MHKEKILKVLKYSKIKLKIKLCPPPPKKGRELINKAQHHNIKNWPLKHLI